jgi:hypothetical protein
MATPEASRSAEAILEDVFAVAEEQLRWQRAAVLPEVRRTVQGALSNTRLRRAYELCDGNRTYREIAAEVGASSGSVTNWTRRWRDLGIAYETSDGRIRHLVSLDALGLSVEIGESD